MERAAKGEEKGNEIDIALDQRRLVATQITVGAPVHRIRRVGGIEFLRELREEVFFLCKMQLVLGRAPPVISKTTSSSTSSRVTRSARTPDAGRAYGAPSRLLAIRRLGNHGLKQIRRVDVDAVGRPPTLSGGPRDRLHAARGCNTASGDSGRLLARGNARLGACATALS